MLYGVNKEGAAPLDGGITEELGVDAVDFVDKLLTLRRIKFNYMSRVIEPLIQTYNYLFL